MTAASLTTSSSMHFRSSVNRSNFSSRNLMYSLISIALLQVCKRCQLLEQRNARDRCSAWIVCAPLSFDSVPEMNAHLAGNFTSPTPSKSHLVFVDEDGFQLLLYGRVDLRGRRYFPTREGHQAHFITREKYEGPIKTMITAVCWEQQTWKLGRMPRHRGNERNSRQPPIAFLPHFDKSRTHAILTDQFLAII